MPKWAVEKQYYDMPELVGFQTMVILDLIDMNFDAVGVVGLDFWLLFKFGSSYCDLNQFLKVTETLLSTLYTQEHT